MTDEYLTSFVVKRDMFRTFFEDLDESQMNIDYEQSQLTTFALQIAVVSQDVVTRSQDLRSQMTVSSSLQLKIAEMSQDVVTRSQDLQSQQNMIDIM